MLSLLVVKQRLQALGIRRAADALLRDDAGDQLMVRHIEGGVVALHLGQSHGLFVPHGLDLLAVPLLDGDVVPVGAGHINRGGGAQHVDGNAVVLSQNRHAGGTDLVGGVAVGGHPVAAHEAGLDPAVLHDNGGHVVADQRHVHPGPLELIAGEPGALEQGASLVGEYPDVHPSLRRQQEGALFAAAAPGPAGPPGSGGRMRRPC